MGVLADAEGNHQEGDQFGDEDDGENLQSNGFPQAAVVGQDLGDDAQTAHGQHPRQGQGVGWIEVEAKVVNYISEQAGGYEQGNAEREGHGDQGGDKVMSAQGGHEAGHVYLVQADEEEEDEDAQGEQQVDVAGGVDGPAGKRLEGWAQQDTRRRVGEDGVKAQPPKNALGQLGYDDEQAEGQERLANLLHLGGSVDGVPDT